MMHITGTQKVTIDISEAKINFICFKALKVKFDIPDAAFIKEDKMYQSVEYYTSHSWYSDEFVRDASDIDKAVVLVLKQFTERF